MKLASAFFLGGMVMLSLPANAASLTKRTAVYISNETTQLKLSVYPGKAAYAGLASGVLGDGTVLDYRFVSDVTAPGGYASGGAGFLSDVTLSGGTGDYNEDAADLWTLTDPGVLSGGIPAFSSAADYGGTTLTIAGRQTAAGSVDISTLTTGTLHVIYGTYDSIFTVTATMSGAGQSDLQQVITVDPPTSLRRLYDNAFNFSNPDGLYDTISYTCTFTSGSDTRGRFMGVVLDGEVPAGAIIWSTFQTTAVTTNSATAVATHTETLDEHVLVWDTTDLGTGSIGAWPNTLSLGTHSAGATSGDMTGLTPDTTYIWRFYGSNANAQAWSEGQSFATRMTDAQAPVFTNASVVTDTLDASLGWSDNASTETGFILLRSDNGVNYTVINAAIAPNTTSYIDTVPLPGTYYYRLAATNSLNGSGSDPALCEASVAFPIPAIYVAEVVLVDQGDNTGHPISVYHGKARYSGNRASGDFGDGTIIDYRFFNPATTNEGYAVGNAGLLSGITYSGSYNFGLDSPNVWTTNDPDTEPANYTTQTKSGFDNVSGTIDISGLYSGEVYILCGGYGKDMTVTLTMTGAGQDPKEGSRVKFANSTRNTYFFRVLFNNEVLAYDTITYTYTCPAKSCFMGVIVDGVTPPAGTVIRLR